MSSYAFMDALAAIHLQSVVGAESPCAQVQLFIAGRNGCGAMKTPSQYSTAQCIIAQHSTSPQRVIEGCNSSINPAPGDSCSCADPYAPTASKKV